MVGWRDIPAGYGHSFAWGLPEERERLEEAMAEIDSVLEAEGRRENAQIDELRRQKEVLREKYAEEARWMEYQDDKLREAVKAASTYRSRNGLLSPGEAQQIDGFYYVHSQVWHPIIQAVSGFDMDIQEVSENALDASHAADAYPVDNSEYHSVTSALQDPLSRFIAVGSRSSEDKIRERVEGRLKDAIIQFVGEEDAEQYIQRLDGTLYHRTLDDYIQADVDAMKEDVPEGLHQRLEAEAGRLLTGGGISEGFRAELGKMVDTPDEILDELTAMQTYLQEKSRGRLIQAVQNPRSTDLSFVLSSDYRIDWPYELAVVWDEEGDPDFTDREVTTHSRLGKLAGRVRRYNRKPVPKELIDVTERLGTDWETPRYWGRAPGHKIRDPSFPFSGLYEGRIYGSVVEGKTAELCDPGSGIVNWAYSFVPTKDNAEVREDALAGLRAFGDDEVDIHRYADDRSRLRERFDADIKSDEGERAVYNFPNALKGIVESCGYDAVGDMSEEALKDVLDDEDIAAGFVSQAVWDRGIVTGGDTIRYSPKNPDVFGYAARSAGIDPVMYERDSSVSGVAAKIHRSRVEDAPAPLNEELTAFMDAYQALG